MKPTRLFDFLNYQKQNNPLKKCLNTKYSSKWKSLSTEAFYEKVQQLTSSLLKMGVKKGDKIALISTNNRTEWCIVDLAVLQLGAVTVPIYPTITAKEYEYILNHSESIFCFISDVEIFYKLNSILKNTKKLKDVFSFDSIENCLSLIHI